MNTRRHINEFFRLRCASDLLALRLFPNAKEITESMSAYHAVRWLLGPQAGLRFDDPNVALVAVGDGSTPRTAALFAFRSAWKCYSIDPRLRASEFYITRLAAYQSLIESARFDFCIPVVIVLVHSHAPMSVVLKQITGPVRHVVAIPCCVDQDIPGKVHLGYRDHAIWSPKNEVKIWKDV